MKNGKCKMSGFTVIVFHTCNKKLEVDTSQPFVFLGAQPITELPQTFGPLTTDLSSLTPHTAPTASHQGPGKK
jgi:hypothetical protein